MEVPCSRVAHTFRMHNEYRKKPGVDFVAHNFKRIAEVWLDEYKENLYDGNPERYAKVDAGDLTREKLIRKNLNCKPFKYFLDNVAPIMLEYYPVDDRGVFANGAIQSEANATYCIDTLNRPYNQPKNGLALYPCHQSLTKPGYNQDFVFSWNRQIKRNDKSYTCFDNYVSRPYLKGCNFKFDNQFWFYDIVRISILIQHFV